jgi:hypothetical protein
LRATGRGQSALQDRALGRPAVLGVVVGAFDVVHVGAEVNGAAVLGAGLFARAGSEVLFTRRMSLVQLLIHGRPWKKSVLLVTLESYGLE